MYLRKLVYSFSIILALISPIGLNAHAVDVDPNYQNEMEVPEEFAQYLMEDEYAVRCIEDENGDSVWYLVNNMDGTTMKIADIENLVSIVEEKGAQNKAIEDKLHSTIAGLRGIVVLLMAALIAVFVMWRRTDGLLKAATNQDRNEINGNEAEGNQKSFQTEGSQIAGNQKSFRTEGNQIERNQIERNQMEGSPRKIQIEVDDYSHNENRKYRDDE